MLQLIAELGGAASIGRFLLGWWASSQRAKIAQAKDWDDRVGEHVKLIYEQLDNVLDFIFGGMAVVCFLILSSTILLPILIEDVRVVWMVPVERSFFFFNWEKLKEYSWGIETAQKTMVLLPFQVAFCTNFISVFLTGIGMRIRK